MPRLKFPTGAVSAAGLRSAPGRTTARGSGYMAVQVDPRSLAEVSAMLQDLDPKLRKQIAGKALRTWGREVRKAARTFAWKNAERTKKQLTVKVKSYKRAIWAGVGVKTEKVKTPPSSRLGRKSPFVGWKSHFMEVGWHAWPKGVSGNQQRVQEIIRNREIDAGRGGTRQITVYRNGKPHTRTIKERKRTLSETGSAGGGRGWRRGIRGRKGTFQSQYARHYMFKAAAIGRRLAPTLIVEAIRTSITEAQRGAKRA